jgi:diguanylate cyclase (GGDEF)-like protein
VEPQGETIAPPTPLGSPRRTPWAGPERVYVIALFTLTWAAIGALLARPEALPPASDWLATAAFFLIYGLFTITVGYQQPNLGYYSFDRVAQVASILVLGPLLAASINGLASFLYPWHRLKKGVPLREVVYAALNNSGLMAAIILLSGSLYAALGGAIPLTSLDGPAILTLILLLLVLQLLNDAGMLALLALGRRSLKGFFNGFSYALELGSGATAILVALIFNTMGLDVLVLTLAVLSVGMLALRQFASMRHKLELIVAERTRKLEEQTRELERQATHDTLTGLHNRRYADEYLARELTSYERSRRHLTVAFADIDLFKQINDLHSHATGDAVLRRVADVLRERCRAADVLARYGGEEFLICLPNTELREARLLCEELRKAIERTNWAPLGLAAGVTISFGIAEYKADASVDRLLGRADRLLYEAKNSGRNRVVA